VLKQEICDDRGQRKPAPIHGRAEGKPNERYAGRISLEDTLEVPFALEFGDSL